jgi:NAD(P)-dependent dehydrogenase (short-subunit alcohol dehydrogenase family)
MAAISLPSYFLVTGGAGGIGAALCRRLHVAGFTPIVCYYRSAEEAVRLAAECDGLAICIDMCDALSITSGIEKIGTVISTGTLAGVVIGASPPPDLLPFASLDSEDMLNQFRVNVIGPQILLSRLIKKHFRKVKSGTVLGILSQAIGDDETPPTTGMGAYVVAKTALKSLLSVCAAEYPWLKVRTVSPGFTRTKMLDTFDPRYVEMIEKRCTISSPDDVAKMIIEQILT